MEDRKPISMSMKDWLIRRLAPKLMISEKTIETVINHQFQSANEALVNNKTIEISGFGKFIFNTKKAVKKMNTLQNIEAALQRQIENAALSDNKRRTAAMKLEGVRQAITALKPKITNEQAVADLRGVEE
jgi:nucleoid DNA-binding protein